MDIQVKDGWVTVRFDVKTFLQLRDALSNAARHYPKLYSAVDNFAQQLPGYDD